MGLICKKELFTDRMNLLNAKTWYFKDCTVAFMPEIHSRIEN